MNLTAEQLRETLCATLCRDVAVSERPAGLAVSLPIVGRDGDHLTAYVSPVTAGWRVSDKGSTLMRLSYEHDLGKLLAGARERLYQTVLQESGLQEDDGELYLDVPADALTFGLFALGQGATRVEDLGLWTRTRVENSFNDDLRSILADVVGNENLVEGYQVPGLQGAENYPVDFFVRTARDPLFIFGVPTKDRARLATIILQHIAAHTSRFNSMVVYSDIDEIPKADQRRLMIAANDAIPSLAERAAIEAKIRHRLAA